MSLIPKISFRPWSNDHVFFGHNEAITYPSPKNRHSTFTTREALAVKYYKNNNCFEKIKLLILRIFGLVIKIHGYQEFKNLRASQTDPEIDFRGFLLAPTTDFGHILLQNLSKKIECTVWINKKEALLQLTEEEKYALESRSTDAQALEHIQGEEEHWCVKYLDDIKNGQQRKKSVAERVHDYCKYIISSKPGESHATYVRQGGLESFAFQEEMKNFIFDERGNYLGEKIHLERTA